MADINHIVPGNPILPPISREREVEQREKKRQDEEKKKHPVEEESGDDESNHDGIDYYA